MTLDWTTGAVLAVILFAALAQSTFGFGNALIAMPLLSLLVGVATARPVVALLSTTVAYAVLLKDWRDVRFTGALQIYLPSILGIPVGFFWLSYAPEYVVLFPLALVVIGFACFQLSGIRPLSLTTDRSMCVFGFLAGLLGGAYNTYGPPIVVYGTLRGWTPEQLRANMQALFIPMGTIIVIGHWWTNHCTSEVWTMYLCALPILVCAALAGRSLNKAVPVDLFRTILYWIVVALGVTLFVRAMIGWLESNG